MEKEYLSIKEFAAAVGISPQAVYKQLNNKLKPYLKTVDGKKTIEKSALSLFEKEPKTNEVEQQLINMLQTELNEKNKQIAELQKLLDQAQRLHAAEKQRVLELEDKMAAEQTQEQEQQTKKKWFKWF